MAEGFEPFYFELIRLLRKSLREEDLLGREDGHLGILLQQTDQSASQNLGRRLSTLIQTLPSFRTNSVAANLVQRISLSILYLSQSIGYS